MTKQKVNLEKLKESMKLAEELEKLGYKKKGYTLPSPYERRKVVVEVEGVSPIWLKK